MLAKDVSIVFKASDNLTASLKTMRQGVKGLQSDVESYKKLQHQVFEEKAKVKLDITQAKQSMKELEKAVKSGSDGAKDAFIEQQAALEALNEEYKRLTKLQNDATRAEKELSATFSKSSNANTGLGGAGMLGALAQAGFGNMLGGAVGDLFGELATSAFGSTVGGAIASVGGNALTGAALGSIAGPIGTAVGAAVGGLTGAIQTLTDQQQKMDDLYREEVQSLYTDTITDMENKVVSGSGYAAERENYRRNYASMTDDATGLSLYNAIMSYGDRTHYDTSVMLGKGMEMLSYGVEAKNVMSMMDMIGNIAMGDTNKFSGLSYAIAQSLNSGTLNGQDRRQMVGWGFDPLEFVSKNLGIDMGAAKDMMSAGEITSEMLVDAMKTATSQGERYFDAVNAMSDTYSGLKGQLESAKKNIEIAMGEGYNEARKKGMEEEIESYTGELGDKMKEAYAMVGAYEAEMENQYQQSMIKAMEEATKKIEEEGLEGLEAQKVMWEAKTNAEIEYKNSEEYQKKIQAEKDLVSNIQSSLAESGEYVAFGKAMADQFSKGWASQRMANASADVGSHINPWFSLGGSHATGLQRVPYDGYIAQLHEGERVLSKAEAAHKGSGDITVAKLADQIIVREDADIDKIAQSLVLKLQTARAGYVGA